MSENQVDSTEDEVTPNEFFRMTQYLLIGVVFYCIAAMIYYAGGATFFPQIQTVCFKLGNVTFAGYIGYWLDRSAFRHRLSANSDALHHLRRAIVMAGAMLAISLGL